MSDDDLTTANTALDRCDDALRELEARCCVPGRSPSMRDLAAILDRAREGVGRAVQDTAHGDAALSALEEAGARVGRLQVGCCAPNRLPLYADMLDGLTRAQLALTRSLGRGH